MKNTACLLWLGSAFCLLNLLNCHTTQAMDCPGADSSLVTTCSNAEKAALTCFDFTSDGCKYKVHIVTGKDGSFPVKISEHNYRFEYEIITANSGKPIKAVIQEGRFTSSARSSGGAHTMGVSAGTPSSPDFKLSNKAYSLNWATDSIGSFHFSVQTSLPSADITLPTTMTIMKDANIAAGSGKILGPTDSEPSRVKVDQTTMKLKDQELGEITCKMIDSEVTSTDQAGTPLSSIPSEDLKLVLPGQPPCTLKYVEKLKNGVVVLSCGDSPGCIVIRQGGITLLKCR